MRRSLAAVSLAALLVTAGCVGSLEATPTEVGPGTTVTVVDVVDGDTVKIEYRNGTRDTARLLGIDTPEVHTDNDPAEFEGVPDTAAGRSCLRRWGERASEFARERLLGATVAITFDANEPRRGSYDRLLVYLRVGGSLFNRQLVERGYARVYDSQFTKRGGFYDLESTAQEQRRGVWTCRTPGETATAGAAVRSSALAVADIHADAPGNDNENLGAEYVVFENTGDRTLDFTGWTVSDDAGHTYRFPDGFSLAPGERVTLYTGRGTDTDTELYWGRESAVWNNGGDTVRVTADNGTVVLERTY